VKQNRFLVQCFSSPDDQLLKEAWERLSDTGTGTVFQRHDFVSAVHDAFLKHSPDLPRYVLLRDQTDDRAVLIMPMIERKRLNVRILETMDCDVIDYAEPLYCPDVFSQCSAVDQATRAFLGFTSKYDVFLSKNWSSNLLDLQGSQPVFGNRGWSTEVNYSVALTVNEFDIYRKRNGAFKQARKKMRRMEKEFGAEVFYIKEPQLIDSAFEVMLAQRRARFQNLGKTDSMADPRRQNLFRTIAREKCRLEQALFIGVRINGAWIATSFAMVHQGVMNAMLSSFAEGPWSRHSPGVVTMALEMEWAHKKGLSKYILGAGESSYKERFGVDELHRTIIKEPMTALGNLYLAAHQSKKALKKLIKQTMPSMPDYKMPIALTGSTFKAEAQPFGVRSIGL